MVLTKRPVVAARFELVSDYVDAGESYRHIVTVDRSGRARSVAICVGRQSGGVGHALHTHGSAAHSEHVNKTTNLARWNFLLAGMIAALSACSQSASTTVEPLTIEALIDVIETSPANAAYVALSNPKETILEVRRDNNSYALDLLAPSGQVNSEVYLDGEVYVAERADQEGAEWFRIVDGETELDAALADRLSVLKTLTNKPDTDVFFDSIADLLVSEGLNWSDYSIVSASCDVSVCNYELQTVEHKYMQPEETVVFIATERLADAEQLTSLTLSWFDVSLNLGYAPQTVSAPSDYTDISYELFVSGAANDAELQSVTTEAENYIRGATQQAAQSGLPVTSREFWETYLPQNAPEDARLWANVPGSPGAVRELVGPNYPYNGIAEDVGETLERLQFEKGAVSVCMHFEDNEVTPGAC